MDTPSGKRAKAMDAAEDRFSDLPDEVRHHVLSFLPARDAARTCVLSPMWRQLWASAPRLNVDAKGFTSQSSFVEFVNALLVSRGCIPLESFWLRANGPGIFLENFRDNTNMWIRYALSSNVEELGIDDYNQNDRYGDMKNPIEFFFIQHCPFTSSYLKKLHLCYVYINSRGLKKLFSGCPVLEDLEMINCEIFHTENFGGQPEFSSALLKSLSIEYVDFPYAGGYVMSDCYIVINMPSLVSLHVGTLLGFTLLSLVDVQSLITTAIVLNTSIDTFADCCKILGALSNVKKLELLFPYDLGWKYSMQDDTHLCGVVFTNLLTLSLSDWCLYDNCKLLLYLLEHSPNLEKLALKMMLEPRFHGNIGLSCSAATVDSAKPFICEKLRKVEIVCSKGDKIVGRLVTILLTKMKSPPEINIKPLSGV